MGCMCRVVAARLVECSSVAAAHVYSFWEHNRLLCVKMEGVRVHHVAGASFRRFHHRETSSWPPRRPHRGHFIRLIVGNACRHVHVASELGGSIASDYGPLPVQHHEESVGRGE